MYTYFMCYFKMICLCKYVIQIILQKRYWSPITIKVCHKTVGITCMVALLQDIFLTVSWIVTTTCSNTSIVVTTSIAISISTTIIGITMIKDIEFRSCWYTVKLIGSDLEMHKNRCIIRFWNNQNDKTYRLNPQPCWKATCTAKLNNK